MAKGLWPVINVSNIDKSLEFYKGLGLRTSRENMGGMEWGNVELTNDAGFVIWGKDNIGPDQAADTRAWLTGELGKGVLFTVGVPNAQKTWAKAQALRFDVDTPLTKQEWGGFGFNLVDPDGYVVNFTDKFPGPPPKKTARKAKPATRKAKAPARKAKPTKSKRR